VENYLPDEAVRFAVKEIGGLRPDQLSAASLFELTIGQFEHYYDAIESHLTRHGVTRKFKGNDVAVGKSLWGAAGKVEFMRKALEYPELRASQLKHDGESLVNKVVEWIERRRAR
jgi:hypothetical protein